MSILEDLRPLLVPHYISNAFLAALYFILKTSPGREWEWLIFLACIVVLKNRKQANVLEYVSTCCMFTKALSMICFFAYHPAYGIFYILLCIVHLMFLPKPVYTGPESITYFRGSNFLEELERDKRVTWIIAFYVAWSPKCVTFAPVFAELSNEYSLDNLKFGKVDISRFPGVAEKYNINTGALSRQLPTVILFQDGKEKERRPIPTKHITLKFDISKENVTREFQLNEIYFQNKKLLSSRKKEDKKEDKKEK